MALYQFAGWKLAGGSPAIDMGSSLDKMRYTVYPYEKDDMEGTATFLEITRTVVTQYVALTKTAAQNAMDAARLLPEFDADGVTTTGRYWVDNIVIG